MNRVYWMLLAGATFGKIALSNDWLLCGPESSFQELFEFATKKATTFCTKLFVLACVSKHYSQYRERMEKQTWDVSAEWGNLFCIVKTTCRKDAGLSAARLSFLALVSSYFSNFSYSFSWRCFRNCSFYAANIFVLSVCQLIRLSSLRVDFGRLSPKVSASLLVSWRSSIAERAI